MKPVFQEIIDNIAGDCFSACIASLLEVPLHAVPKFARDAGQSDQMMHHAREWLAKTFRLSILTVAFKNPKVLFENESESLHALKGTPCIACVESPNFENTYHAVVGEIDETGLDFRILHDPRKDGKPITKSPGLLYFLVPMQPHTLSNFNRCERCNQFPTIASDQHNQVGLKCECRGYLMTESEWRNTTSNYYE